MAHHQNLRIYQQARANIRTIDQLTGRIRGYADICNQMQRASMSVAEQIAEGSRKTRRAFIDKLRQARGEVNELQALADILSDIGRIPADHHLHADLEQNGRSISALITHLRQRG